MCARQNPSWSRKERTLQIRVNTYAARSAAHTDRKRIESASVLLSGFDPLVSDWFGQRLGEPTEPQARGWPAIRSGHDVLISAPTGAGKTLAAFLICLDGLVRSARAGSLPDEVHVVYVSPLKALSNDIQKNLERPLAEIRELAESRGVSLAPITTAVRTGDTTPYQRRKMIDRPPHILVTTPESLYILLTAERSRSALRTARVVIVDEIHAVLGDKRGSHLALSVERLARSAGRRLQRVGLSATVRPLQTASRFLGPSTKEIQVGHTRPTEIRVEVPGDELGAVATQGHWDEIRDRVADLVLRHRTTLVFVNTRRIAERLTRQLEEKLPEDSVLAHHGSLATELRLDAERRLKTGNLRAVVATASLELGIDIGTVDLVCQIGTPRSIGGALQRVGRSGHWKGAIPKGRFFASTRDELIECAALARAVTTGQLDRIQILSAPVDVMAQQIVAEAACGELTEDECFEWVRSAYPYNSLDRETFDEVITMLADGISSERGRFGAYLHHDRVNGRIRARRGARLAAITSGGAIPDSAQYQVIAEPEGGTVGMLDEDFAIESSIGDVFLLGSTSWRIRRVEPGRVRVEDAHSAAPTVPFWLGEAPGRTWELSHQVGALRRDIEARSDPEAIEMLRGECRLDLSGAEQAVQYIRAAKSALGVLPTHRDIVAERFFDESGGMQLVLHAPFGTRVNRAWGLALRKRFCRSFNLELQAAANDNGITISLTEQHSFPLELVFEFLSPQTLEHTLTQALLDAPMFITRWRWNVSRSLAVLRFSGGRKTPPPIQRMRAEDLLASVFPDQAACAENLAGEVRIPSHPLVSETIENCLREAMDVDRLAEILDGVSEGTIRTHAVETAEPSPLSHEILNANPWAFLDNAPLEERRARAVQVRRTLPGPDSGDGALSAEAIARIADEVWPVVRNADELHDALLTLVVLPPVPEWEEWFAELSAAKRATVLDRRLWVTAERLTLARRVCPQASMSPSIDALEPRSPVPDSVASCAAEAVAGWLESTGPATAEALAVRLGIPRATVGQALAELEDAGLAMQGRYSPDLPAGAIEWCNRRVLARIHRLTLRRLRRDVRPVSTSTLVRFFLRWQHMLPTARMHGTDGVLQAVRQLEGYEAPAAAWEAHLLPARVQSYAPAMLDQLCLAGTVMWGRLSPHPALKAGGGGRVRPTRAAPLTLFLRENCESLIGTRSAEGIELSHPARALKEALLRRGALFFNELRIKSGHLASEVEDGLWELVAAGLVTADGFDNLRSLIDPKRRRGEGRGRTRRPRHAPGRWALLPVAADGPARDTSAFARQLLARWGVVFRDLLKREPLAPSWRELLASLRAMEVRGEVRGGRFVEAFLGEQFALPEALDLLRRVGRDNTSDPAIAISSADPLNVSGIVLPGPRVPSGSGRVLHIVDGAIALEPLGGGRVAVAVAAGP